MARMRLQENMKARKVTGLAWRGAKDGGRGVQLSWTWYGLELATVLVHVLVVAVVPIVTLVHAMSLQHLWGILLCPEEGIDGQRPLLWTDVTGARIATIA